MSYSGLSSDFSYDYDGLLTSAGRFTISRNLVNGLPEQVSAGSFQVDRLFNDYGEIKTTSVALSGSKMLSYDLTKNENGQITVKDETVDGYISNFSYTYDSLGRLLTVTKDGSLVEEYRYNANGNRVYEMNSLRGITGRSFTYSIEDHTLTAGPISFEFDYDDNIAARIENSQTTEYSYSSTGELQWVTLPDNTLIEYVNDPLGRRIAKKVNGLIQERYLWLDRTTLLAVYDSNGNLHQRFEYADDRVPYAMTQDGNTYYLAYDQVGSLRIVIDNFGNTVKHIEYDSFGNIINDTNPSFTVPFGFAGGLHDRDIQLVRFGHRDYMPEIGKWTAKDPILFAGGDANLYGYAANDPVNLVDPDGLAPTGFGVFGFINIGGGNVNPAATIPNVVTNSDIPVPSINSETVKLVLGTGAQTLAEEIANDHISPAAGSALKRANLFFGIFDPFPGYANAPTCQEDVYK